MQVLETPSEVLSALTCGKAFNLARLACRFEVPPFVVVVPDADGLVVVDPRIERRIRNWDHVAVRSSADVEDSHDASFAGMFETELGVALGDLWDAVRRVAESCELDRVAEYQRSQKTGVSRVRVSVVIQKMVTSDRAGVAFSRLSTIDDRCLVEAVFGLGEGLVGGRYTPDRYYVGAHDETVTIDAIGYQKYRMTYADHAIEERVNPTARNSQKLNQQEIVDVARLAREVEEYMGFAAADIEWTYERKHLFLLQARPYTGFEDDQG